MAEGHISIDTVAWIGLGLGFGPFAAYLVGLFWVTLVFMRFRTDPEKSWFVPSNSGGRADLMLAAWWVWTKSHISLNDRSITCGVIVVRTLMFVSVFTMTIIFRNPDFAERLTPILNGRLQ